MTTPDRPTQTVPARTVAVGDIVMGWRSCPDREIADLRRDQWGTWVTYTDGVHDSYGPGARVVVVL